MSGIANIIINPGSLPLPANIVTGTGTNDHIARWDGTSAIQDSAIIINDAGQILAPNGSESVPSYSFINDTNTGIYLADPGTFPETMVFVTNGTNRMLIDQNGFVSIGNPPPFTPQALLEVDGGKVLFNTSNYDFDFQVNGTTATAILFADASTNNIGIKPDVSGDVLEDLQIGPDGLNKVMSITSAPVYKAYMAAIDRQFWLSITRKPTDDTYFTGQYDGHIIIEETDIGSQISFCTTDDRNTLAPTTMIINELGRVGVGTTVPDAQMTVAGDPVISNFLSYHLALNNNTTSFDAPPQAGIAFFTNINTGGAQSIMAGIGGGKENTIEDDVLGCLAFFTNQSGGITEVARFDSTGKFGIGTLVPEGRLHVVPTSGIFLVTEDGNIAIGANPSSFETMSLGIFISDAATVPTGDPSGGGFLYVESGALKYRGSSGTITTIANA